MKFKGIAIVLATLLFSTCEKPLTDKQAKKIIKGWVKARNTSHSCNGGAREILDMTLVKNQVTKEKWDKWLTQNLDQFLDYNRRFQKKFCNQNNTQSDRDFLRRLLSYRDCKKSPVPTLTTNSNTIDCTLVLEKKYEAAIEVYGNATE